MHLRPPVVWLLLAFQLSSVRGEDRVSLSVEDDGKGTYHFYAANRTPIPQTIQLSFPILTNLKPSESVPHVFVVKAGTTRLPVMSLSPIDRAKSWRYKYQYNYFEGDVLNARHDSKQKYLFPFEHGKKFNLSQGYNGPTTHKGKNALDFTMEIGTPVCAARDGTVVGVKEDSNEGGPSKLYDGRGNFVKILHDDGTFALYLHLKQHGAAVSPGDRVTAGQVIGYSGNTGRSSGPHLHFAVSIPTREGLETVKTLFTNHDGKAVLAEAGKFYYSTHPGKERFKVELAQLVSASQYSDYRERVEENSAISFRTEKIDNAVVLFIRNGFGQPQRLLITFELTNASSDEGKTVELIVPGRTEKFVSIIRQVDPLKRWRYSYRYQTKNR